MQSRGLKRYQVHQVLAKYNEQYFRCSNNEKGRVIKTPDTPVIGLRQRVIIFDANTVLDYKESNANANQYLDDDDRVVQWPEKCAECTLTSH